MDRENLIKNLNHWYPVLAALLSSLLTIVSFLAGVGFTLNNVAFLGVIVVVGLAVLSAITVLAVHRLTLSAGKPDFQILDSTDECRLQNSGKLAVYRRTETIEILKDCNSYMIPLPLIGKGFTENFRVCSFDDGAWYSVNPLKWIDGTVLSISFRRLLTKGEIIENLCVEWDVHDCYTDEDEGIWVLTCPGQKRACIHVVFPHEASDNSISGMYCKIYPPNPKPLERQDVKVNSTPDGRSLEKVFENLPLGESVKVGISWHWRRDVRAGKETN